MSPLVLWRLASWPACDWLAPRSIGSVNAGPTDAADWWERLPSFGDKDSGDGDANPVAIVVVLIALAVLAVGAGIITATLVFLEGRKKAHSQLARTSVALNNADVDRLTNIWAD